MKLFTLTCYIGLTLALPNGYNYNQNTISPAVSSSATTALSNSLTILNSENNNLIAIPSIQSTLQSSPVSPTVSTTLTTTLPQTVFNQRQNLQPIITKNYYVHSAPDDEVDEEISKELSAGPIRKHYRIVFIKAPSQSNSVATALRLAQAKTEDRTVIYVLSKKTDLAELQGQLADRETQSLNNKPEVYFIKYKTPDEALLAQQQIQAQYDALGGTSEISDEGIAPVQSVIGSLDSRPSPFVPTGTYLPPHL